MIERRRSPRYQTHAGELALFPASVPVRVIDLSVAGALLQSAQPVTVGTRGQLRLNLEGEAFCADVQVCRVTPQELEGGFDLGAEFVGIGDESRQLIERFART